MLKRLFLLLILVTGLVACGGSAAVTEPAPEATEQVLSGVLETTPPPATPTLAVPPTIAPPVPTATAKPSPTPEPSPTPLPTVPPIMINAMPADQFIVFSDEARQNVREIFARGQELGRDPATFAILGDSLIATPQSLARWEELPYELGDYAFLQPTLDYYAGSFSRYGVSVRVGLHSWSVFDPLWADKEWCEPNEDLLTCEFRLNNPSVLLIFLGSNDAGSPGGFSYNLRQILDFTIENGVVPIMATKADRFEGADNVNNQMIREIAADYQVPLLEFDILADTLPGRGLSTDNVHLTFSETQDYTLPETLTFGYPVHNLATLMMLDQVRRELAPLMPET